MVQDLSGTYWENRSSFMRLLVQFFNKQQRNPLYRVEIS